MTGDTRLNNRGGDLLLQLKNKGPRRMLDKAVQFNSTESDMDSGSGMLDEGGDRAGSDYPGITVAEINGPSGEGNGSASMFSNPFQRGSEEEQEAGDRRSYSADNLEILCPDSTDTATMIPFGFKCNNSVEHSKPENESMDEIKEQSLVVLNNCVGNEEKLKELSEPRDDSNCALDCLSFTLQCCECTIL